MGRRVDRMYNSQPRKFPGRSPDPSGTCTAGRPARSHRIGSQQAGLGTQRGTAAAQGRGLTSKELKVAKEIGKEGDIKNHVWLVEINSNSNRNVGGSGNVKFMDVHAIGMKGRINGKKWGGKMHC